MQIKVMKVKKTAKNTEFATGGGSINNLESSVANAPPVKLLTSIVLPILNCEWAVAINTRERRQVLVIGMTGLPLSGKPKYIIVSTLED